MKRREFITLLGSATVARPLAAQSKQPNKVCLIGVLRSYAESDSAAQSLVATFHDELTKLGWREASNLGIETRWGASDADKIEKSAKELADLRPDVILASTTPTLKALLQQTHTIPIVFYQVSDPLGDGFVASLARPGGNVTGFANLEFSISGKWIELLNGVAPAVTRVIVILDPENPTWRGYLRTIETVAPSSGLRVIASPVINAAGIERALEDFAREPHGGVVVLPGPVTSLNRTLIVALANRFHLPSVFALDGPVRLGGLISYAPDLVDQIRKAAVYVDRILKGEKPSELPVQFPTKFNLVINLKTAKALGLTVPPSLLATADEVIE